MMNRLKYRIFDKRDNKLKDILGYTFSLGFLGLVHIQWANGFYETSIDLNDLVFCQCTGLKDKNGKLIYEGDLLRYPAKDEYEKKHFCAREVFFQDNDCCDIHIGWQMNRVHFQGCLCGENVNPFLYKFKPKNVSKMEIIGNIYENYELLKEAQ